MCVGACNKTCVQLLFSDFLFLIFWAIFVVLSICKGVTCVLISDLRSEATYKKAMKDLNDPLLPTRGHALILLTKLLQERNVYAVRDHEKLLDIFQTNLCHDDSYLYLSSIDGLIALVDIQHERVLPLLCRKFAKFPDEG